MVTVLVFAATLAIAVLVSQLAHRTVLSTAVLFLAAGFVAGPGVLGVDTLTPSQPAVHELADLALFSVLFTDGMGAGIGELRRAWRLPGRALLFGMPLTLAAIALLARYVGGLGWTDAFLLGAVLSPTDPVFAAALVGREGVPRDSGNCLTSRAASTMAWRFPSSSCFLPSLRRDPSTPRTWAPTSRSG